MREKLDPRLARFAQAMRKAPTDPERRLWWALRHHLCLAGTHFRRQVVISRYIVDFACIAHRIAIEVDGDQHGSDEALAYDARRDAALRALGWRVLRFSTAAVRWELESIVETVLAAIEGRV